MSPRIVQRLNHYGADRTGHTDIVQAVNRSASEGDITGAAGRPFPHGVGRRAGLLLTRLGAVMTEIADEQLAEAGLTGREYAILAILVDDGPGSQLELAGMLGKAPALLVPSIDRLEDAGLVERTRDPNDRRRSRVKVTRQGTSALARGDAIAERVVARTFHGLDDAERAELSRLLEKGVGLV
jgi:MarR family transcriptional regulator, lower aerobic nicotinate degradation pathway regulator